MKSWLVRKKFFMPPKFVAPKLRPQKNHFTCPECETLTAQVLVTLGEHKTSMVRHATQEVVGPKILKLGADSDGFKLYLSACTICSHTILWAAPVRSPILPKTENTNLERPSLKDGTCQPDWDNATIIYPRFNSLPPCNTDAPNQARKLYREAAEVYGLSNRASAALIRVALEALLQDVFQTTDKLYKIIEDQKVFLGDFYATAHALRLIGNDGAHPEPEAIDLDEDVSDIVESLFLLFNELTDDLVSRKKRHVAAMAAIAQKSGKEIPGVAPVMPADEEETGTTE